MSTLTFGQEVIISLITGLFGVIGVMLQKTRRIEKKIDGLKNGTRTEAVEKIYEIIRDREQERITALAPVRGGRRKTDV